MVRDLTPARAADLLAVALNVAAHVRLSSNQHVSLGSQAVNNVFNVLDYPSTYALVFQLPAAAVEALAVQLQGRNINLELLHNLPGIVVSFCQLPAAAQLPTAALVELAQQAAQLAQQAAHLPRAYPGLCVQPFLKLLPGRQLTDEQVEGLLSLLRGPAAAAARSCRVAIPGLDVCTVELWLASQPGAAAAAVRLGLTAADVRDPAAAMLLFGIRR